MKLSELTQLTVLVILVTSFEPRFIQRQRRFTGLPQTLQGGKKGRRSQQSKWQLGVQVNQRGELEHPSFPYFLTENAGNISKICGKPWFLL